MNKTVTDRAKIVKEKEEYEHNQNIRIIEEDQIAENDNKDTHEQIPEEGEQEIELTNGNSNVEGHIKNYQSRINERNERERKQQTDEEFKQNKKA
eukprot:15773698-Heterocapsa_arctica.AAC.1